MPEKLAVDGAFGNSAAVHRYVALVAARAVLVDDFREKFLSRAALADDEHTQVDGRHAQRTLDGPYQGGRFADDAKPLLGAFYFLTDFHFFIE